MLSNPESLSGELQGGTLTLHPKNDTVKTILNADRLALIRRTAEQLTGANTPVVLAAAKAEGEGRFDRLDLFMDKFNIK